MVWIEVKGLIEAGIKILSDKDLRGAKEVLKEVIRQREEIKKTAEARIEANINLDPNFEKSDFTKGLIALKDGNQAVLKDALEEGAKSEAKILSDLGDGLETQDQKVADLISKLEALGVAVVLAEEKIAKQKKTGVDTKTTPDNKGTINAIKSIAPQFGQLVETGSSAALRLFSSNQNPMVKEQQKTNNTLEKIAENTSGFVTV